MQNPQAVCFEFSLFSEYVIHIVSACCGVCIVHIIIVILYIDSSFFKVVSLTICFFTILTF